MTHEGEPKSTPEETRSLLGQLAERNGVTGEAKETFVERVIRRITKSPTDNKKESLEDTAKKLGVDVEGVQHALSELGTARHLTGERLDNFVTEGTNLVVSFKEQADKEIPPSTESRSNE